MSANIAEMAARARDTGTALWPHAKTFKNAIIASRQLEAGAEGLTVATLDEAHYFADADVEALLIAYTTVGGWRESAVEDLASRVRLRVVVDNRDVLELIRSVATRARRRIEVLWEVDTGAGRLGTQPGCPTVDAVLDAGADDWAPVIGLLAFPGHAYRASGDDELRDTAAETHPSYLPDRAILTPCPPERGRSTPRSPGRSRPARPACGAATGSDQTRRRHCCSPPGQRAPDQHGSIFRRPLRGQPDRSLVRQDTPPPTQPRRRSTSQLGALHDHHRPHPLGHPHPGLRPPTCLRRQDPSRSHPLPQALHQPGKPRRHQRPRRAPTSPITSLTTIGASNTPPTTGPPPSCTPSSPGAAALETRPRRPLSQAA